MKTKVGYMPCPDCGERVMLKVNERETLSYRCDECDGSGYSKKGEGRYQRWLDKANAAAPAKVPVKVKSDPPAPKPASKPAPKPAAPAAMPWMRPAK